MNYGETFRVRPGRKLRLKKIDPAYKGHHEAEATAAVEIEHYRQKMAKMQSLLYAEKKRSVLIVLQALDAGGKDGTVNHVLSVLNPQGARVVGFKQPSSEELAHDFLWRIHPQTPAKGDMAIFNRSHYEDVLVTRVHKLIDRAVWEDRYKRIRQFEDEPGREWHPYPEILPAYLQGGAARALRPPAGGSAAQLEDQRIGLCRARALGRLHRRLRGCHRGDDDEGGPLVRDSREPQMVPQPRGLPDHRRYDGSAPYGLSRAEGRSGGYPAQISRRRTRRRRQATRARSRRRSGGRGAAARPMPAWLFASLRGYRLAWLPRDLVAGLMLAAIAIPGQLATARLAGMPPETGLYAFAAGSLAFAAFGANRFISVGADSTIAPIFAGGLAAMSAAGSADYAGLAGMLAILVGAVLVLVGLLRAGWLANLLSIPVTTGFLAAHLCAYRRGRAAGAAGTSRGARPLAGAADPYHRPDRRGQSLSARHRSCRADRDPGGGPHQLAHSRAADRPGHRRPGRSPCSICRIAACCCWGRSRRICRVWHYPRWRPTTGWAACCRWCSSSPWSASCRRPPWRGPSPPSGRSGRISAGISPASAPARSSPACWGPFPSMPARPARRSSAGPAAAPRWLPSPPWR